MEDLREVLARAAELLPETPGRVDAVLARRRRRQQRRAMTCAAAVLVLIAGVAFTLRPSHPDHPAVLVPAASDPSVLVGRWTLEAAGVAPGSAIILGESLTVFLPCGNLSGGWTAEGADGLFLGSSFGGDQGCFLPTRVTTPWLDRARAYAVDGENRLLLDASGQVVATLRPGATPTAGPNADSSIVAEPTAGPASVVAPAPLPAGVRPPSTAELQRHWLPPTDQTGKAFVAFGLDGRWSGSDGCNGSGGPYALGSGGRLLVVPGFSTLIGCSGSPAPVWVEQAGRVGLVDGDLVFYDREAHELGRVHPG